MLAPWPPPLLESWCSAVDAEPDPLWLVKDLIPTDAAVQISGKPKLSKKSWFAFELSRVVAAGRPSSLLIPAQAKPLPVLYLALEKPRKPTRARFAMLARGHDYDVPRETFWLAHRAPVLLTQPHWQQQLKDFIAGNGVRLCVLDTLIKASEGDENSAEDVNKMMRAVDVLRSAGCTVMYLHHLSKGWKDAKKDDKAPDIDDEVRGSSVLAGHYDMHLALRESPGEGIQLTARYSDGEEKYYRIAWDFSPTSEGASCARLHMEMFDPKKPIDTDQLLAFYDALAANEIYSMSALTEIWNLTGDAVQPILKALLQQKFLTRTAKGYKRG